MTEGGHLHLDDYLETLPLTASRICQPKTGGCCSLHRRGDRIYEDHVCWWPSETARWRPVGAQ